MVPQPIVDAAWKVGVFLGVAFSENRTWTRNPVTVSQRFYLRKL